MRWLPLPVAALALLAGASSAPAAAYCSPSGDACKAVAKVSGRWTMELRTAALYAPTRRYRLCVRDPRRTETCRGFRLRKGRFGIWTSKVTWSAHFPTDGGRGTYRVRWRHGGTSYGPPLRFKR